MNMPIRKYENGLKVTSQAEREALKEGAEAKKAGRPCVSPYLDGKGEIIPLLRNLHRAWLNGWTAG
jgi:hypothetical protein